MLDFGALVKAAEDRLMQAGDEVLDEVTEEIDSLDDVFMPDEFGTEGLW